VCLGCFYVPDPPRNDAGLAGAELALAVESHVLATGSIDTVGTTGTFEIAPGAINSVPRDARLAIGEVPLLRWVVVPGQARWGNWRKGVGRA
jgi:hypothetical protein